MRSCFDAASCSTSPRRKRVCCRRCCIHEVRYQYCRGSCTRTLTPCMRFAFTKHARGAGCGGEHESKGRWSCASGTEQHRRRYFGARARVSRSDSVPADLAGNRAYRATHKCVDEVPEGEQHAVEVRPRSKCTRALSLSLSSRRQWIQERALVRVSLPALLTASIVYTRIRLVASLNKLSKQWNTGAGVRASRTAA